MPEGGEGEPGDKTRRRPARWRVEGSRDGKTWREVVTFQDHELAHAALEAQVELGEHLYVRILRPDGKLWMMRRRQEFR